jgi:hypothetical protein
LSTQSSFVGGGALVVVAVVAVVDVDDVAIGVDTI